ncbi:MAG: integrase core domain-containing protein, partial [Ilumatobacteraceae bacterium]
QQVFVPDSCHNGSRLAGVNAAAESFFGSLKRELAHRQRWATRAEARRAVIRWIEGWFNSRRLHSSLNYCTPIETETNWYRRQDGIAA